MTAQPGYCWLNLLDKRGCVEFVSTSKTEARKQLIAEAAHKINLYDVVVACLSASVSELEKRGNEAGGEPACAALRRGRMALLAAKLPEVR